MPEILKNGYSVVESVRFGAFRVILAYDSEKNQYATWIQNGDGNTFHGNYFQYPNQFDTKEEAYSLAYADYLRRVANEGESFRNSGV